MIFCEHCFNDKQIAAIVRSHKNRGVCPVCGSADTYLYDTEKSQELTHPFEGLLGVYSSLASLPKAYPNEQLRSLSEDMKKRWHIFNDKLFENDITQILIAICPDVYAESPELFEECVGIPELCDPNYLEANALLKNNDWNEFVKEIKTKNRYHLSLVNFERLKQYLGSIQKEYKTGQIFYRARISGGEGYGPDEMSAPPPGKSSEGRTNARGITCLYVSKDAETTLCEVRAGVLDFVSVGQFRLKRDVTVVDFSQLSAISPFSGEPDFVTYAINKPLLERLDAEMSRSLRRGDSTLDYVPTQYIVDYIKSINKDGKSLYAGVEYTSTINKNGINLAFFEPELLECVGVDVYDIDHLQYIHHKLDRVGDNARRLCQALSNAERMCIGRTFILKDLFDEPEWISGRNLNASLGKLFSCKVRRYPDLGISAQGKTGEGQQIYKREC